MISPTDILKKEHKVVLKLLEKIEKNLEKNNINQLYQF